MWAMICFYMYHRGLILSELWGWWKQWKENKKDISITRARVKRREEEKEAVASNFFFVPLL